MSRVSVSPVWDFPIDARFKISYIKLFVWNIIAGILDSDIMTNYVYTNVVAK